MFKLCTILFFNIFNYNLDEFKIKSAEINDLIFKGQYKYAEQIANELISENKNNPTGYLFLCDIYIAKDEIFRTNSYEVKISELHKKLDDIFTKKQDKYLEGLLNVQKIFILSKKIKPLITFEEISRLENNFNYCVKNNICRDESYYYLLNLKYWKNKYNIFKSEIFDYSKELIATIKSLENNNSYLSNISAHTLIWIYYDLEEYEKMEMAALNGLKKYPDNIEYLWGFMTALEKMNKYQKLFEVLNKIENVSTENKYTLVTAMLKKSIILHFNKKDDEAKVLLNEIIKYDNEENIIGFDDKITEARKLLANLK